MTLPVGNEFSDDRILNLVFYQMLKHCYSLFSLEPCYLIELHLQVKNITFPCDRSASSFGEALFSLFLF